MQKARVILTAAAILFPQVALAIPQSVCIDAAHRAADATGIPADLLVAITLTETRHAGTAWPWTINHDGKGSWYATRKEAVTAAQAILDGGGTLDAGCFQINTGWHPDAFATVDQMFDPEANAIYAAGFLRDLHARSGNWEEAVAAYNSGDPELGEAYLLRVGTILAELQSGAPRPAPAEPRENGFPLLLHGAPATGGSLVPRLARGTPLIGAP